MCCSTPSHGTTQATTLALFLYIGYSVAATLASCAGFAVTGASLLLLALPFIAAGWPSAASRPPNTPPSPHSPSRGSRLGVSAPRRRAVHRQPRRLRRRRHSLDRRLPGRRVRLPHRVDGHRTH